MRRAQAAVAAAHCREQHGRGRQTGWVAAASGGSKWLRVAVVAVLAWGLRSGTLHQPGLTCERKASPRQPATPHIAPDMARLRLLLV